MRNDFNSTGVDVGMVHRTLREPESEDFVKTKWGLEEGPPRRKCRLAAKGHDVLDEWVVVIVERGRLLEAFLARGRVIRRPRGA